MPVKCKKENFDYDNDEFIQDNKTMELARIIMVVIIMFKFNCKAKLVKLIFQNIACKSLIERNIVLFFYFPRYCKI